MARKPKSATHQALINNAKKKKVSKNPYVRYPDTKAARQIIGMDKIVVDEKQSYRMNVMAFINFPDTKDYDYEAQMIVKENLKKIHNKKDLMEVYRQHNLPFDYMENDKLIEKWESLIK